MNQACANICFFAFVTLSRHAEARTSTATVRSISRRKGGDATDPTALSVPRRWAATTPPSNFWRYAVRRRVKHTGDIVQEHALAMTSAWGSCKKIIPSFEKSSRQKLSCPPAWRARFLYTAAAAAAAARYRLATISRSLAGFAVRLSSRGIGGWMHHRCCMTGNPRPSLMYSTCSWLHRERESARVARGDIAMTK